MRKLFLWVGVSLLFASGAQSASYRDDLGDWHGINYTSAAGGGVHPYSGPDLTALVNAPGAQLPDAYLFDVWLSNANLSGANLSNAYLYRAGFYEANLSAANLSGANLEFSFLISTYLSGADLTGAKFLGHIHNGGVPNYDALTTFTNAWSGDVGSSHFNPETAGWNLVPEPPTGPNPPVCPLLDTMNLLGPIKGL